MKKILVFNPYVFNARLHGGSASDLRNIAKSAYINRQGIYDDNEVSKNKCEGSQILGYEAEATISLSLTADEDTVMEAFAEFSDFKAKDQERIQMEAEYYNENCR